LYPAHEKLLRNEPDRAVRVANSHPLRAIAVSSPNTAVILPGRRMVLPRVRAYSSGSRTCQYNAAANTVSTAVPMIQKPVRIAFLIVFTPFSQNAAELRPVCGAALIAYCAPESKDDVM